MRGKSKWEKGQKNTFEKPEGSGVFIISLIAVVAVAMFSNYLYIPALPLIARDLSVSNGAVVITVTATLIGTGISQLFYGSISDSYGRKKTLIVGIVIVCIGTIFVIISSSISQLIIARFVMGLGLGSASVLYRVMLKDYFPPSSLGWAVSTVTTFTALLPAVSPFIGGMILIAVSWRILFVILLIYSIIIIFFVLKYLPETHKKEDRIPFTGKLILNNYLSLFNIKGYFIYVLCIIFSYACLILYITSSPFIYQNVFHLSPAVYGALIVIPTLAFVVGGKFSASMNKKDIKLSKLISCGFYIIIISCIFLTFSNFLCIDNYIMTTNKDR